MAKNDGGKNNPQQTITEAFKSMSHTLSVALRGFWHRPLLMKTPADEFHSQSPTTKNAKNDTHIPSADHSQIATPTLNTNILLEGMSKRKKETAPSIERKTVENNSVNIGTALTPAYQKQNSEQQNKERTEQLIHDIRTILGSQKSPKTPRKK